MRAFGHIVDTNITEGILLFYIIRKTGKNNSIVENFNVTVNISAAMGYYVYEKEKGNKKKVKKGDYVAVYLPKNNEKYRPLEIAIERNSSQQQYKYLNISEKSDWKEKEDLKGIVADIIQQREWSEWSNAPASLELNVQVNSES